jgi:lipoprotein-releasing system permease protein
MPFSFYTAKRLITDKKGFASAIVKIGLVAVGVSVAVMIGALAIMQGYKQEILSKLSGFNAHIVISSLDFNESDDALPLTLDYALNDSIKLINGVQHIQFFAHKAGIIQTTEHIEGIVIKGIDSAYQTDFIESSLVKGKLPDLKNEAISNDILISSYMADRLSLDTGTQVTVYFIQDQNQPVRVRRFGICGIFKTGMEDFDRNFALGDIRHIKRLYNWNENQVEGIEIITEDFKQVDRITEDIYAMCGPFYSVNHIRELKPQLFDWLGLLDTNVLIIMVLMTLVAVINMVTSLLILIVERTKMIGILKSMGTSNVQIQNIFIWKAAYLIGIGLLIGNVLALGFGYLQNRFTLIRLDPDSYYLDKVPFHFAWDGILLINLLTFLVCLLAMLIPARMVNRINTIDAIRFE